MKWKIVDSERDTFVKKQLLNPRKGGGPMRLDSSSPSSPALNNPPSQATERLMGALGQGDVFGSHDGMQSRVKSPPRSATPPLTSYPVATESYTPDRGPRPQYPFGAFKQSPGKPTEFVTPAKKLFHDNNPANQNAEALDYRPGDVQPSSPNVDPMKPNVSGMRDSSANSPPTLYSDNANPGGNSVARGLVTPLITRHAPRLAPPSTAHVPSQFMHFSSPAPFWKYVDLPSTPAKGHLDISPIKLKREDVGGKDIDDEPEPVQPSSPPIIEEDGQEAQEKDGEDNEDNEEDKEDDMTPDSPTRTVSRPVSRAHLPASASQRSRSNSNMNSFGPTNGGMVRGASLQSVDGEGDEQEIDLTK
jgi:hypothetical protein